MFVGTSQLAAKQPNVVFILTDNQGAKHDPHERFNLFGQPQLANVQAALARQLDAFFEEYADPQYDIWKGGRSKARRLVAPEGHPDYRPPRN